MTSGTVVSCSPRKFAFLTCIHVDYLRFGRQSFAYEGGCRWLAQASETQPYRVKPDLRSDGMEHGTLQDLCRIAVEIESPSHVDTHSDQLMKHFKKIDPFDGLNVWVKKESERKVPARSRGEGLQEPGDNQRPSRVRAHPEGGLRPKREPAETDRPVDQAVGLLCPSVELGRQLILCMSRWLT